MNANETDQGSTGLLFLPKPGATRSMIYQRTVELATMAGRPPHAIKQTDYERAKREIIGEADVNRRQMIYDRMDYA